MADSVDPDQSDLDLYCSHIGLPFLAHLST